MKNLLCLLLLAGWGGWTDLRADITIAQKADGTGKGEVTTLLKPGKVRVNISPEMSMIMDLKSGEIISLMHAQKSYMKLPAAMAQAVMAGMQKDQSAPPTLTATGKSDTIGGYACDEYTTTMAGKRASIWLTKALPDYQAILKEMGSAYNQGPLAAMMKGFSLDMSTLPGFPMRIISEMPDGKTVSRTVTSVDEKPIDDSAFEIPADYKQMTMPNLTPPGAAAAPPAK